MSATIEIPFAIGQEVWHCGGDHETEIVTCPECVGTCTIKLTLGNGETYEVGCRACGVSYEPAKGYIERRVYVRKPRRFRCNRLVRVDSDGAVYTESSADATAYSTAGQGELFATEDECQRRCDELNAQTRRDEEARVIRGLESARQDLAWSVHYWRGKKRVLERELAAVSERLDASNRRAKRHDAGGEG